MKENTKEKSLININENSIFYKIKTFLKKLFIKNESVNNIKTIELKTDIGTDNKKSDFIESLKNIENEETKLLKMQKQFRAGEIKEKDLTEEQINSLCALYDEQIKKLKRVNEFKRQKLLEYRKKI